MSRIVLHIDMNSYFASVEQQANPFLRGKPIGVTGKRQERSIVATASIEAKARGVKTAMSTWQAKRICPDLILVTGDPQKYAEITNRFNALFLTYTDLVERFSVDESFLDITDQAKDWLGATFLAQQLREDLKRTCGEHITASIGIAANKTLAKLASEQIKPNGITVIKPEDTISVLDRISLTDICGIGKQTEKRLHEYGLTSMKKIRERSEQELRTWFGSYGTWLYQTARGIGDDEVIAEEAERKSVGHSYTLSHDTIDKTILKQYLLGMCEKVAWRLRKEQRSAKTIVICLRYSDFRTYNKQCALTEPIQNGLTLFEHAWKTLEQFWDHETPIRLLGISAHTLVPNTNTLSLFPKTQKADQLLVALDALQTKFGSTAWTRASLLPLTLQQRVSGLSYDHEQEE